MAKTVKIIMDVPLWYRGYLTMMPRNICDYEEDKDDYPLEDAESEE